MKTILLLLLAACRTTEKPAPDGTYVDDTGTGVGTPLDTDVPIDTPTDTPPRHTADTGESATDTGPPEDTGTPCLCDDGLACTTDSCDAAGRCIAGPLYDCPWPASLPPYVASVIGADPELEVSLSGATWNPATGHLWLVRNSGNPSLLWRLVDDGLGGWVVDADAYGVPATFDLGEADAESVTLVDPVNQPYLVHAILEGEDTIAAFDVSVHGVATVVATWDASLWLPSMAAKGSEGLAFVPDAELAAWGFVDEAGLPRTSALGMGGLMFVASQAGGRIYVFDLDPAGTAIDHVGAYETARAESSGLELDPLTGRLYIWHGEDYNDLEVARLSSTDVGGAYRVLDAEAVFDYPMGGNMEGIALPGPCVAGLRPLLLVTDDGGDRSADLYADWPLCP